MSIRYEEVVPWGRSFDEYVRMFMLDEGDLDKKILGCGDGPASFNCEMKRKGKAVVSVDPVYGMKKAEIEARIGETYDSVLDQTGKHRDKFLWDDFRDVEDLGRARMSAMRLFLDDFEKGLEEGRYVCAALPELPFGDGEFDLALSSHFLFLYSDNLSLEFHYDAMVEMLRVAREVRIFPLLDVNAAESPYVEEVRNRLHVEGFISERVIVPYEFQKGGNTMLRIVRM